jgi:hypothetical protein
MRLLLYVVKRFYVINTQHIQTTDRQLIEQEKMPQNFFSLLHMHDVIEYWEALVTLSMTKNGTFSMITLFITASTPR